MKKYNKGTFVYAFLIYFGLLCVFLAYNVFNKGNINETLKLIFLPILISGILLLYIRINKTNIFKNQKRFVSILVSIILEFILVIVSMKLDIYTLWLICPAIIAFYSDAELGIIFLTLFIFNIGIVTNMSLDMCMYYFIVGFVLCIMCKYMRQKRNAIYAYIITFSLNIATLYILFDFKIDKDVNKEVLMNSIFLLISMLIISISDKIVPLYKNLNAKVQKSIQEIDDNIYNAQPIQAEDDYSAYEQILAENFTLIRRMRKASDKFYRHNLCIAEMSEKAALAIEADAVLARVGGMYHEIGKLVTKDENKIVQENVNIARTYGFPQELLELLMEQDPNNYEPKTKESCIVILTDMIVTTITKSKKDIENINIYYENIIRNIFDVCVGNGMLKKSGISTKDIYILKQFYIRTIKGI